LVNLKINQACQINPTILLAVVPVAFTFLIKNGPILVPEATFIKVISTSLVVVTTTVPPLPMYNCLKTLVTFESEGVTEISDSPGQIGFSILFP